MWTVTQALDLIIIIVVRNLWTSCDIDQPIYSAHTAQMDAYEIEVVDSKSIFS